VEDPFDFRALRIRQPGKLLPDRANYEIFNADRQLLATVTEGLKEMLTPSDHYAVEFTGLVSQPARTLTVMMPIVLDLTMYGPD
jgi:hypothetical protein